MHALVTLLCIFALGPLIAAHADEGMWTYDALPQQRLARDWHVSLSATWADHIRLSTLRLAQGCSASLVSGRGLVLTDQHCVADCARGLSTPGHDLVADGFVAATDADERRCPDVELDELTSITPVTGRIDQATHALSGAAFAAAERRAIENIEAACNKGAAVRCDVVTLFHGGKYDLYTYRRFQDVRLVFAAETGAANFADPNRADWPYYDFDVGMLRVYDNGKTLDSTASHLKPSRHDLRAGDLVFVAGNPGDTERLDTVAQLEAMRDVWLPTAMMDLSELHGMALDAAGHDAALAGGLQQAITMSEALTDRVRKQHDVLSVGPLLDSKRQAERALRARTAHDPAAQKMFGRAWDNIARAADHQRDIAGLYTVLNLEAQLPLVPLFRDALLLVRGSNEARKPDAARLPEFQAANLPALRQEILSPAPIDQAAQIRLMTWLLTRVEAHTGTAHPAYRALIGHESEAALAQRLVAGTKLRDAGERKRLLDGGFAAIAASTDPLIMFVRDTWEPLAMANERDWVDNVTGVYDSNAALIDRARQATGGADVAPDATFTPRLSFGAVSGYSLYGQAMPAFTTLADAFAQETGQDPFRLPARWHAAGARLDRTTTLDFVAAVDIVGGNSGSPVVDRDGDLVGLVFAVNDAAEANVFINDPVHARGIAVTWPAIRMLLRQAYGAGRLVDEMMTP